MQTLTLKVDLDGRVTIPGTHPGETIQIKVEPVEHKTGPTPEKERAAIRDQAQDLALESHEGLKEPLTRLTAHTEQEKAQLIAEISELAQQIRKELGEDWQRVDHADFLYGEDGLPL